MAGESLLNDGSALVLFTLFKSIVLSGITPTGGEVAMAIIRLSIGGPLIGIAVGAAASYVLGFILNDPLSEITVTVVVGFGCYVLAESTGAHASGVLSMVFAGLYMSFYGRGRVSARVRSELNSFWNLVSVDSAMIAAFSFEE
jgi:NhaP-type Na+/H+ or K+/H+ antiporter